MRGKILGFRLANFTSKTTGEVVEQIELCISCKSSDWIGNTSTVEKLRKGSDFYNQAISLANADKLVNSEVFIDYNIREYGNFTRKEIVDFDVTPEVDL